ncbi:archaea-specific SMC-related protein [Halovivax limisalsi]|uniref:archaea-specific SMC-related protein n=1 Tax=Halovivax limisalsi TaxID=1453760 RepID=UPI001FFCABB6|nr:archaea-specific SMC-related protein [Halovivax limisalsi]
MSQEPLATQRIAVDVTNVGGIDDTTVEFSPGVTVLAGRNATNRTSFLRSVMAALGSEKGSLKSDADEGAVSLSIGDETYTRTFERRNGTVRTDGDPYLEDGTLADLFAFLLETNEARRAVRRGGDLRELIMRPVDTAAIKADIDRLQDEKASIRDELDELDELERERTRLETERTKLVSDLEDARTEREEVAATVDDADRDVEETRSEKDELESTLEELNDVRSELESVRFEIETQRDSLENLREERESLREAVADAGGATDEERGRIEGRLDALRERKSEVESTVNDLQRIVRFNEELLGGGNEPVVEALRDDTESGEAPTDALLPDDGVVCWTCGSEVDADRIEATIERLRDVRQEHSERRRELKAEIEELTDEKRDLESERREREQTERRLERVESEIDEREATLESLQERRDEYATRVEALEDEVETLDVVDEYDDLLESHRRLNQVEFRIDQLEDDLAETESAIDEIDARLAERDSLEADLEAVEADLETRRTEIERIETEAVSHFNEHMEAVLDILEYGNLERIWIERTAADGRDEASAFDLHVVRSTADDAVYEDTIDHLSESEREVTGLVFALAGYLVHDVHEHVPFMLLDSLEAIDSDRIARLVEYVSSYADSLLVALLPEDAAALPDEYERIREI